MGGPGPIKIDKSVLTELVAQQPDATLKELHDRLGVGCSESAVCTALMKMGISFKKRRSTRLSRTVPMSRRDEKTGKQAENSSMYAA